MVEKDNVRKEDNGNYVELQERQILEKIKDDLNPIQEDLLEKKITVDDARYELKKINEWIQWTKLEQEDKKEIWKAFEKLVKLEENIDENLLKDEVEEIIKLVEKLTKKDLVNLKQGIQQNHQWWNPERRIEVQEWINVASNNLNKTINNAAEESWFSGFVWRMMKRLNS